MMAIGEQLQQAVATKRVRFNDDICGISLSVRFTSYLITVWNRDGDNKDGVEKIKNTILENLPEDLVPKDSYYKRHSEHAGFDEAINTTLNKGSQTENGEEEKEQKEGEKIEE